MILSARETRGPYTGRCPPRPPVINRYLRAKNSGELNDCTPSLGPAKKKRWSGGRSAKPEWPKASTCPMPGRRRAILNLWGKSVSIFGEDRLTPPLQSAYNHRQP